MTTTTLADAKARFSELVASAEATHERTIITKNGRPTAVILSADELDSIEETLAILSDPDLIGAIRERSTEKSQRLNKDEMMARLASRRP